jgi:hypothetical protein
MRGRGGGKYSFWRTIYLNFFSGHFGKSSIESWSNVGCFVECEISCSPLYLPEFVVGCLYNLPPRASILFLPTKLQEKRSKRGQQFPKARLR